MARRSSEFRQKVIGRNTLLGACILIALLVVRFLDPYPVEALRLRTFDFYQRIKPRETVSATGPVIIVAIDEPSLKELGQWPWPRNVLTRLTEKLAAANPKAIAFDVLFAEPSRTGNDGLFATAVEKAPVVLGQAGYWQKKNDDVGPPLKGEPIDPGPVKRALLPKFKSMVRNLPELEKAASGLGVLTLTPGKDSIVRRMPTVFSFQDRLYPSFALETLRVASNKKNADALYKDLKLAMDRYGRIWPYFSKSTPVRFVSAKRVLSEEADLSLFRNKIILIGASAIGLGDFKTTPVENGIAGVEVHAQTIESILQKELLERPHYIEAAELTLALFTGLVVIVVIPLVRSGQSLVVFLLLLGPVGFLSWTLFSWNRFLFDPSFPVLTLVILYFFGLIGRNLSLESELR